MTPYLDTPEKWVACERTLRAAGVFGLDTETYGHDVKTSSPAYRAKIDVWSVAVRTPELSPVGYHVAAGAVLPVDALPYFKELLEDELVWKVLHNARHDRHSLANHGVQLRGVRDTLERARLLFPGLEDGFALKPLRVSVLRKSSRDTFKDVTAPLVRQVWTTHPVKTCACGTAGCKKRSLPDHAKLTSDVQTVKEVTEPCPIESVIPGHPRWAMKCDYAGDDAVDGLELDEMLDLRQVELARLLPPLPWGEL